MEIGVLQQMAILGSDQRYLAGLTGILPTQASSRRVRPEQRIRGSDQHRRATTNGASVFAWGPAPALSFSDTDSFAPLLEDLPNPVRFLQA